MTSPTDAYSEAVTFLDELAQQCDQKARAQAVMRQFAALRRAPPSSESGLAEVVFDNLPYLENLIDMHGHSSGLLKNHCAPCGRHDFCLMRQAQKGVDAIRAYIRHTVTRGIIDEYETLYASPQPSSKEPK